MKVYIDRDELFPYYDVETSPTTYFSKEVDLDEDLYKRYVKVANKFFELQSILSESYYK